MTRQKYNLGVRINERNIRKVLSKVRPSKILDAGCGEGYLANRLSREYTIWGLDKDKQSVMKAQRNARVSRFRVGDVTDMPFEDDSFDAVIASEILEHLPDETKFINEIGRVIAKGAILITTTPCTEGILKVSKLCHESGLDRHYRDGYTFEELSNLLSEGFTIVDVKYTQQFFTRIIIELMKRGYSKCGEGLLFKIYKLFFPIVCLVIYLDEMLSLFMKGSNIMVIAMKD